MYKIAIIGLGYVGLPLAKLFASKYTVIGFDIDQARIAKLNLAEETFVSINRLFNTKEEPKGGLFLTSNQNDLKGCNIFIVTVPTPIDNSNNPDLSYLLKASETIGYVIKKDDIVIYESTVYPGATEEDCIPVIEKISGLKFNKDFYAGYSPERVSPGDKSYTIEKIKKITSGSTPEAAKIIDNLYTSVIAAGTYLAPSIKVAEAAKVIENAQRDINIAFINETKKILDALNIDTKSVLAAASTKWNFVNLKPGLVGGHCIGVDPYYLVHRAERSGYIPELILSARKTNEGMSSYVANQVLQMIDSTDVQTDHPKVLILGFTFKANCSDIRNTKVKEIISILNHRKIVTTVYDPYADSTAVKNEYNIDIEAKFPQGKYNAIIIAVNHSDFDDMDLDCYLAKDGFIYNLQQSYSTINR